MGNTNTIAVAPRHVVPFGLPVISGTKGKWLAELAKINIVPYKCTDVKCAKLSPIYPFTFNTNIAEVLRRLVKTGGSVVIRDLNPSLTYSQRTNSQKLAYWGLATPVFIKGKNKGKGGVWQATQDGIDFYKGLITLPRRVFMLNNVPQAFSNDQILFHQASKLQETHPDYVGYIHESMGAL